MDYRPSAAEPGLMLPPLSEPPGSASAISQRRSSHWRQSLPGDSDSTYCSNGMFLLELADPSLLESRPDLCQRTACVHTIQHPTAPHSIRLHPTACPRRRRLHGSSWGCAKPALRELSHLAHTFSQHPRWHSKAATRHNTVLISPPTASPPQTHREKQSV